MKQKKPLNLNPFVLIFAVVVVAWLFTFIITPGTLVDGVYTALPKNAFNFNNVFNLFRAVPMGIKDTSNLVILVLVIGGALEIYKSTGAIDSSITKMVHKFGSGSRTFLLIALMVLFSVIGGFLGWIETLIPFAPLVVAMILALGYDGIVACAVLIIGLMGGFVTGPTNLYTVGVCNGILQNMGLLSADSDVFVGLGFRAVLWAIMTIIGVAYTVVYANRIAKDPAKSLVHGVDVSDLVLDTSKDVTVTGRHVAVLLSILAAMIMTVIGMQKGFGGVKWGIDDVSAVFLASALFSGIVGKLHPSEIANSFVKGAGGAVGGALDGRYYLHVSRENEVRLLVYDTERGLWHEEDVCSFEMASTGGQLYLWDGRALWAADPSREAAGQRSEETEQGVEFALTTGDLGLDSPEERYLSRLTLRLDAECTSTVEVAVSYDGGAWETAAALTVEGPRRNCDLHLVPRRCASLRLRLWGYGQITLRSLAKTFSGAKGNWMELEG